MKAFQSKRFLFDGFQEQVASLLKRHCEVICLPVAALQLSCSSHISQLQQCLTHL